MFCSYNPSMYDSVVSPTMVIDASKAEANLTRVASRAAASGAAFRPHFKTHQSLELGRRFRALGVDRITVSSVSMARYFAADGWDDITIAFPANIRELHAIDELAGRIRLGLLADHEDTVARLGAGLHNPVDLWIKIDLGTHRCGILPGERAALLSIMKKAATSPRLVVAGLLAHDDRTYQVRGPEQVNELFRDGRDRLFSLRDWLATQGMTRLRVSYGDTPTASLVDDFSGIDELRPGNFAYYDLQQLLVGSCSTDDIAAAVACPVAGIYPARGEVVVYGGAVHFSKQVQVLPDGRKSFGALFQAPEIEGGPWGGFIDGAWVRSLSQEHGIIVMPPEELGKVRIGDLAWICPVHSCLAQHALRGNTLIIR
jgi:D-serine deaminase-like pyridoxal phosphate-dependent protein